MCHSEKNIAFKAFSCLTREVIALFYRVMWIRAIKRFAYWYPGLLIWRFMSQGTTARCLWTSLLFFPKQFLAGAQVSWLHKKVLANCTAENCAGASSKGGHTLIILGWIFLRHSIFTPKWRWTQQYGVITGNEWICQKSLFYWMTSLTWAARKVSHSGKPCFGWCVLMKNWYWRK